MYFSFKKERLRPSRIKLWYYYIFEDKRNLPFCMACALAYVRFPDVVTSRPCLAMHPGVSGCIDAPHGAVGLMLHSWGVRDKKAGVKGRGVISVVFIFVWMLSAGILNKDLKLVIYQKSKIKWKMRN